MLKWFFERACVFYCSCGKIGVMEGSNNTAIRRNSNRGLYLVLGVLAVVIMGLVIGIMVVKSHADNSTSTDAHEEVCSDYDTVEDVQLCIEGKVDDSTTVDDWANYYQDAIDAAVLENDDVLAAGLLSAKIDYLVGWGRCNEALKELDGIDNAFYSLGMLVELYRDGIYYADLCNDSEASQRFTSLYNNTINGGQNA